MNNNRQVERSHPDWVASRERGTAGMLRIMTFLSLHLGRQVSRVVLYGIAGYFFLFAPSPRRHMRDYLRRVLGRPPSPGDRFRLLLSFATTIHDRVYLLNQRLDLFDISIEGHELADARINSGQGVLLMGAHMGSFEVIRAVGLQRPDLKLTLTMYEENARKISSMLSAVNPSLVPDIIPLGRIDSMLKVQSRLAAGVFVGVLGDRTIGEDARQKVTFLGTPAWFPTSAMRAAAMLRCPVIFMVGLYRGANRYRVVFEKLADFSHTPREQRAGEVRIAVERYAALLEQYCRSDPYNWFNFFNFWKELPCAPP